MVPVEPVGGSTVGVRFRSSSAIRQRVKDGPLLHAFNGIARFLFEDRAILEPLRSRTALRKECKELAYQVIQRSNAWSRLIADCFPQSLRLSIHPQDPHSEKIGILLTHAEDNWLTPWHGVVVLQDDRFTLTHSHKAEERGAKLVARDGRPSHFVLSEAAGR